MAIPPELKNYVPELLAAVGGNAKSLWLFGSRANGRARADSDWDLLLFANSTALETLRATYALRRANIDLIVAVDPQHWISPWPDGDAGPKGGSASLFHWAPSGPGQATYRARPLYQGKEWWREAAPVQEELMAYQIWPECAA